MLTLLLILACSNPPEADVKPDAPPVPIEEQAPEPAVAVPDLKPSEAKVLGVSISWKRSERSRDSHSITTRTLLQDKQLVIKQSATGRARGRIQPPIVAELTNEQLAEVKSWIAELGLEEQRNAVGQSGSEFKTITGFISIYTPQREVSSSVSGAPSSGAKPPPLKIGSEPPTKKPKREPTIEDDPVALAIKGLAMRLKRLAKE